MKTLAQSHSILRGVARRQHAIYLRPQRRQFHHSPQHRMSELFELSHNAFQSAHTWSGWSWGESIVLTGVLFRLSWFPFQFFQRINTIQQASINPLINAWGKAFKKQAEVLLADREVAAQDARAWVSRQETEMRRWLREKYGITTYPWFFISLGFLPVWIINADVIRRMTGQPGVIAPLLQHFNIDPADIPLEAAFSHESFLWIPNLVSADPLYVLPICFGAIQYFNIWSATGGRSLGDSIRAASTVQQQLLLQFAEVLRTLTLLMPVALIYYEMPTAVMLFLMGSAVTQTVQRYLFQVLLPGPPIPKPSVVRVPALREEFRRRGEKQSMDAYIGPQKLLPEKDLLRFQKQKEAKQAALKK